MFRHAAVAALVLLGLFTLPLACSDESDAEDDCCAPASSPPIGCASYGGAKRNGQCDVSCTDGQPCADDPGWTLKRDAKGCMIWFHEYDYWHGGLNDPERSYCGYSQRPPPPSLGGPDASADADASAEGDASTDAATEASVD